MSGNLMVLLPLLGFMAGMLALGFYVRRQSAAGGFLSTYFVGGQSLGGFVLAMTMVATYSSAVPAWRMRSASAGSTWRSSRP